MKSKNLYLRLVYDYWRRNLAKYAPFEQGLSVLECGTGPGYLFSFLQEWFPRTKLYGIDIDCQAILKAKEGNQKAECVLASAQSLPFANQTFDVIITFHMVEHLVKPKEFFQEAQRVLRTGGTLIMATPNPVGIGARLLKQRWTSYIPEHISLHPPSEWQGMLAANGFSILREGTTGLSGIPIFRKIPLSLVNRGFIFLFGFFPWGHGEAYVCIAKKII
jgi:ubiquinone/menaquinone biosynthesis C-methylase UbiE